MKFLVIKRNRGTIFYLTKVHGQNTWSAIRQSATEFDQATAQAIAAAESAEVIPA